MKILCVTSYATLNILLILSTTIESTNARSTSKPPTSASVLRDLLSQSFESKKTIAVPGVHDALSAKIFTQNKSTVLFLSGFGVSASHLAQPDAGILTLSEMEEATRNVVAATNSMYSDTSPPPPVIVDGDTGYGGAANVRRTIRNLAKAGAAAITIEDQIFPKKCTYAAGENIRVISQSEACARIKTALSARKEAKDIDGNDVLIIARTDCRAALGMEEVIQRCLKFEELGADIVYAENLQSKEEYIQLRQLLKPTTPMMLAQLQLGQEPSTQTLYPMEEMGEMGYNLALFGVTALQATVATLQSVAKGFDQGQVFHSIQDTLETKSSVQLSPFSEVKNVVGFPELDDFVQENPCL